jgi:hypothetical protein
MDYVWPLAGWSSKVAARLLHSRGSYRWFSAAITAYEYEPAFCTTQGNTDSREICCHA